MLHNTSRHTNSSTNFRKQAWQLNWKKIVLILLVCLVIVILLYLRLWCDYYHNMAASGLCPTIQPQGITMESPVNHFNELAQTKDGLKVTWAHAVNSHKELQDALRGPIMMLEADVLLRYQGLPNQTDTPVMAHPPDVNSDITLEEWISEVINTTKGIKLDFKYIEALEPSMEILKKFVGKYQQPIWLNADILTGPDPMLITKDKPVNPGEFKSVISEHFPASTLSIGWTTAPVGNAKAGQGYTQKMVAEMTSYARDINQPITFPVRAVYAKVSWPHLSSLLDQSPLYTITIWSSIIDDVNVDDLVYVRKNSAIDKIYYDLPKPLMEAFLERLEKT